MKHLSPIKPTAQIGDTFAQIGLVGECPQVVHKVKSLPGVSEYITGIHVHTAQPAASPVCMGLNKQATEQKVICD
ncbi:MAG TPA: hypothetical protein VGY98_06080 [Verrucomicrobiae bacterium]|jgi:hypothetical protein|nr:hypothetical protein [Verrucomicrobiae bacterium]